ncbi:hypothetical protein BGP_1720 [Beggiatoa sp. PS]|nr:hypothetical protein BGP_1720 [Beggiatoa sp. PS]
MLQTFKAILTKNQIQWIDEMPPSITDKPIQVYVMLPEPDNETTLTAISEIEAGGGKVFENVDDLFKDLEN